jgi:hypothetical protein
MHRIFHVNVPHAILAYAVLMGIIFGAADYLFAQNSFPAVQPVQAGTNPLINRLAWYESHLNDYNLIILGDSRTYCGVHAELLDPMLGTSSLNLASFAHWFPTQLAFVRDIAPSTRVLWSIGSVNFHTPGPVQRIYPVGIRSALRYLRWGLSPQGLADNVFYYNSALHFISQRGDLRKSLGEFMGRPLLPMTKPAVRSMTARVQERIELKEQYEKDPNVAAVVAVTEDGKVNSLAVYFQRGATISRSTSRGELL